MTHRWKIFRFLLVDEQNSGRAGSSQGKEGKLVAKDHS